MTGGAPAAALLTGMLLALVLPGAPAKPRKSASKTKTRAARQAAQPAPEPKLDPEVLLDQARRVPILNAAALEPFFEQLYLFESGTRTQNVPILQYGDSHTASDEWSGLLRALFQNRFGNGGIGFSYAGKPSRGYRHLDLRSSASRGWRSEGLIGRRSDGRHGLGGVSVATARAGERVSLESSCDTLEIYYWRQPGGGSLELRDNGAAVARIATDGPHEPGYFRHSCSPGPHLFTLETKQRAPVRLFGWVCERSSGVTYEPLGINGAQASLVFRWDEQLLAEHLARRHPALLVLAYGTNDASNKHWNRENYSQMFASLLYRFRRMAPSSSILVIGPPDRWIRGRGRTWKILDSVDAIVEAQRQAALGTGCSFWDLRAKMGGKGSMRHWVSSALARSDHAHFTPQGYRLLACAVFQDLIAHYETFVAARQQAAHR